MDNPKLTSTKEFVLILISIIFLVIEIRYIKQILIDIIGIYFSTKHTIMLNIDESFRLKSTDSLVIGHWELDYNDDLIIDFNIDGKKSIQIGLTYFNGLPQFKLTLITLKT